MTALLDEYEPKVTFSPDGTGEVRRFQASLIPTLDFDPYNQYFSLEFHVASPKKAYIVKSISSFYNHLLHGETVTYGKQLVLTHRRENFDQPSQFYLDLMDNAFDWLCYGNQSKLDGLPKVGRYLHLSHNQFDQLFDYVAEHGGEINCHQRDGAAGRLRFALRTPETTVQVVARSEDEFLVGVVMDDYKIFANNQVHYLLSEREILRPRMTRNGLSSPTSASAMTVDE